MDPINLMKGFSLEVATRYVSLILSNTCVENYKQNNITTTIRPKYKPYPGFARVTWDMREKMFTSQLLICPVFHVLLMPLLLPEMPLSTSVTNQPSSFSKIQLREMGLIEKTWSLEKGHSQWSLLLNSLCVNDSSSYQVSLSQQTKFMLELAQMWETNY